MKRIWLIVIGIFCAILCFLNFFLLLFYQLKGYDVSVLATIISGWISGLATFCVGLIAFLQNKGLNDKNERTIKQQTILNKKISLLSSIQSTYYKILELVDICALRLEIISDKSDDFAEKKEHTEKHLTEILRELNPLIFNLESSIRIEDKNDQDFIKANKLTQSFYNDYILHLIEIVSLNDENTYNSDLEEILSRIDETCCKVYKNGFDSFLKIYTRKIIRR